MQAEIDFNSPWNYELDLIIHTHENSKPNEAILNSQRARLTKNCIKIFDCLKAGEKLSGLDIVNRFGMLEYRRRIKDIAEYLIATKSEISISEETLSNGAKVWWLSNFDYKFKNNEK